MVHLCEVLPRCAASMANLECFVGHSLINTPLHKKTLLNRWLRMAFSDPGRTADPRGLKIPNKLLVGLTSAGPTKFFACPRILKGCAP